MLNDKIAKWVLGLEISSSRKAVLIAVLAYANWQQRTCYPGISRLSQNTGFSERTVRAALNDLCQLNLLHLEQKGCRGDGNGKGRMANVYRVNVPEKLLPANYRTKRQALPKGQAGLTGNQEGLTGNEQHDQTATIASQDSHRKITSNQESLSYESGATGALSFVDHKKIIKEATDAGVRSLHIQSVLKKEGPLNVSKALGIMSQWQTQPNRGDTDFARAMQKIKEPGGRSKGRKLRLPSQDAQLESFAKKHGLSDARIGEHYPEYRTRLKDEIRRMEDEQEKLDCIQRTA